MKSKKPTPLSTTQIAVQILASQVSKTSIRKPSLGSVSGMTQRLRTFPFLRTPVLPFGQCMAVWRATGAAVGAV